MLMKKSWSSESSLGCMSIAELKTCQINLISWSVSKLFWGPTLLFGVSYIVPYFLFENGV